MEEEKDAKELADSGSSYDDSAQLDESFDDEDGVEFSADEEEVDIKPSRTKDQQMRARRRVEDYLEEKRLRKQIDDDYFSDLA